MERGEISLFKMFVLFMKIGVLTIGGGYVMIPLMQEEFVNKRKLLDVKDFCDVMAVAQAGPGGVAINSSIVVGYRIKGVPGAVAAAVGTVFPSFAAIVALSVYLLKYGDSRLLESFLSGARPAVVGLLLLAAYSLGKEVIEDKKGFLIASGSFAAVIFFDVHPVAAIVAAGFLGYVLYIKRERDVPDDDECRIR